MDDAIKIIQQVGFPVAVALWLLMRTDKRLDKIADVESQNGKVLSNILEVLRKAEG